MLIKREWGGGAVNKEREGGVGGLLMKREGGGKYI